MDKSMLGDLDSLPKEDKLRMSSMIDQLQIRDSLRMYNSLVERCFTDCVTPSGANPLINNRRPVSAGVLRSS